MVLMGGLLVSVNERVRWKVRAAILRLLLNKKKIQ